MENNKGITLITLVTSIILLIIIASITILTNIDAFNYMRFEGEKTEIEQMEKLVDEIASDYQTYLIEENTSKKYEDYFNSRYNTSDFNMKLLSSHKNEAAELINKNTGLSSESDSVFILVKMI